MIQTLGDFLDRLLNRKAKELFGAKPVSTAELNHYLDRCTRAY